MGACCTSTQSQYKIDRYNKRESDLQYNPDKNNKKKDDEIEKSEKTDKVKKDDNNTGNNINMESKTPKQRLPFNVENEKSSDEITKVNGNLENAKVKENSEAVVGNDEKINTVQRINKYSTNNLKKKLKEDNILKEISNLKTSIEIININEISGSNLIINSCEESVIVVFDYTKKVVLKNLKNCSVFIGPCDNLTVENVNGLKLISCSKNITSINCKNSIYSILSKNSPIFKNCESISLNCFNFSYPELKSLLRENNMSNWDNKWSEIVVDKSNINIDFWWSGPKNSLMSQNNQNHISINVNNNNTGVNINNVYDSFGEMRFALRNQGVSNFNNYYPVPYTYGTSIIENLVDKQNILLVLNDTESEQTICELCEFSKNNNTYLIKSKCLSKERELSQINYIIDLLKENLDKEIVDVSEDIFNSFRDYNKIDNKEIQALVDNEDSENIIILLWFCCDKEDYEYLNDLLMKFDNSFEQRLFIDDTQNDLLPTLKRLFF